MSVTVVFNLLKMFIGYSGAMIALFAIFRIVKMINRLAAFKGVIVDNRFLDIMSTRLAGQKLIIIKTIFARNAVRSYFNSNICIFFFGFYFFYCCL